MRFKPGQKIICATETAQMYCINGVVSRNLYPVTGSTYTFQRYVRKIDGERFLKVRELKGAYSEALFRPFDKTLVETNKNLKTLILAYD